MSEGPILAATDGSIAGETAFRVASMIASKLAARVRVVMVVEPLPVFVLEPSVIMQALVASPELLNAARDRVIAQLREVGREGVDWNVDIEYGRPSAEIADKASDCNAQLIVIGLVHHGIVDRILDGDTALEVVRQSESPILLASPSWKAEPMTAVFAVDFSRQSMEAARAGLRLLGDGATVVLAHVRPTAAGFDGAGIWEEEYEKAAERELTKFSDALGAHADICVKHEILRGSPTAALLGFADRIKADLIVAGTRGAGFMQRLLLGSVATRLMRHTTHSLLIIPDAKE